MAAGVARIANATLVLASLASSCLPRPDGNERSSRARLAPSVVRFGGGDQTPGPEFDLIDPCEAARE